MTGRRLGFVLGGIVFGLSIGFVLPDAWLFVGVEAKTTATDDGTQYACPMFCVVEKTLPPDGKCSVCGMELASISAAPTIDRHERMMIGLEPERLRPLPLVREVRLFGEVDYDDTRVVAVSARADGWLERVDARVTWADVDEGDALFALYSPSLFEAQQEFLSLRNADASLRDSAVERLRLLGLDRREIDAIAEAGVPQRTVTYRAPRAGTIVRRHAVEGAAVTQGQEIYAIADLDRVWLQMEAFESDLPLLRTGVEVRITADVHRTDEPVERTGRIAFVDPIVDPRARTVRVRVEMDNPRTDGRYALLPGQRVVGVARLPLGADAPAGDPVPTLAIARDAVLRTGERTIVYVLHGMTADGAPDYAIDVDALPDTLGYELVEVALGPLARRADAETREDYYPLVRVVPPPRGEGSDLRLRRLRAGHVIARHGALLLDSQAQLAGRPSLRFPAGRDGAPADPHANH